MIDRTLSSLADMQVAALLQAVVNVPTDSRKKGKDVLLGEFNALFNAISKSEISRDRRGESAASTMSITSVNIRTGEGVELVIDRVI